VSGRLDIRDLNYLTEEEVLQRWPFIKPDELRAARNGNVIGHFKFSTQRIVYTASDVETYIKRFYKAPCKNQPDQPDDNPPSSSEDGGSDRRTVGSAGTDTTMTKELEESVDAHLSLAISNPPKPNS